MNVVSLFSGAGGLDFGFEAAGFRTRFALDLESSCRKVLRANFNCAIPEDGDVKNWTGARLLREAGIKRGGVDVLIGGPPCQPYSKAAYWATGDSPRLSDSRSKTLDGMLSLVDELLPRVVLLENVPGIAFTGKDEALTRILARFRKINRERRTRYKPCYTLIDSAEFGVPQHRRRFFLVAAADGRSFQFPNSTHGAGLLPFLTCWDAFHDLETSKEDIESLQVRGKWASLLPTIPEGYNYLWHTDRGGGAPIFGWRTRYWSFLLKLARSEPAWTIPASPGTSTGPFHWENRRLSRAELMRLQTFPRYAAIDAPYTSVVRMLGNAVPSLMAEVLARAIGEQMFDQRFSGEPKLLPTRTATPAKTTLAQAKLPEAWVPRGDIPKAHPGTGAGPGAMLRATKEVG